MIVRRLLPADAPAYRALMLDAYARHPDAFTSTVEERSALPMDWWRQRLSAEPSAGSVVYGAFDTVGTTLQGAAGLGFETRERSRHKASLFGMYMAAPARGTGCGRQLVQALLAHARARGGLRVVQLTVTEGNAAALRLYESCGFQIFGIEPLAVAVDGGFQSKVHMWLDLDLPAI